jgi:hypothetical protein
MKFQLPVAVEVEVTKEYFAEVAPLIEAYEESPGASENHW